MSYNDLVYLSLAWRAAQNSPDTSTQLGAVLVTPHEELSVAYNTFPQGVEPRLVSPEKYLYIEHAERNAILKAARGGVCTRDSTMYAPWYACADCARAIIQAGVRRVVGIQEMFDAAPERWSESVNVGLGMLAEAGVAMDWVTVQNEDPLLFQPSVLFDGKPFSPAS